MKIKHDIEEAIGDPAALERLYRTARTAGDDAAFIEALRQLATERPENVLLRAWIHRLDVAGVDDVVEDGPDRRWWTIVGASVLLGLASALLVGGGPPVPFPGEANVLFWVGWGPLVAVGVLGYLAWSQHATQRRSSRHLSPHQPPAQGTSTPRPSTKHLIRFSAAAATVVAASLYVGLTLGARTDDAAFLGAIHLLFVSWAVVGAALCLGYSNPARQSFAYLVKSAEAVLTGGIFFGAGLIFVGLTYGIFAVLGIELPEKDLVVVAAWAVGAIPLLAIGTVYDPASSPAAQDGDSDRAGRVAPSGLSRTLRILARLILPLALGVLLVYVLWFIPVYFRKPFEERDVLIVYNATILAIMVLLAVVVSGPVDSRTIGGRHLFRYAVLGLGLLTLILNGYALAAVVSRTVESGLTPNRFAVIGWNVTTLLILAGVGVRLWRDRRRSWVIVFRESMGRLATLAAVWAVVLLVSLPFFG